MKKTIRIGCSSGFWGDAPWAARQLVMQSDPPIDYLVSDYLAEVTMCILARYKGKKGKGLAGDGGFIEEFVTSVWKPLMKPILKKNIKIVTNAGGLSPHGLKSLMEQACKEAQVPVPKIAAVTGDDILESLQQQSNNSTPSSLVPFLLNDQVQNDIPNMQKLQSANAYIGALPIAKALQQGAQVVITGRVVDSAVVLGPCIAEFGWDLAACDPNIYHKFSGASLAGHLIECGCHATGGNLTDWRSSLESGWKNMGYPIAEIRHDGSCVISKPKDTGGIVTRNSVSEQLVYEIQDPSRYILPDVVCDWTNVSVREIAKDEVLVEGAKGNPPTEFYKVAMTGVDGFKMETMLLIGGIDAREKALHVGQTILDRASLMLAAMKLEGFTETNLECIGCEGTYGKHSKCSDSREVFIKVSAAHPSQKGLGVLARNLAPAALSTAPGIFGAVGTGRPHPTPLIRYYSALIPKSQVPIYIKIGEDEPQRWTWDAPVSKDVPVLNLGWEKLSEANKKLQFSPQTREAPLISIAYGRSGDKGDSANIGLIARSEKAFVFLAHLLANDPTLSEFPKKVPLSAPIVQDTFSHLLTKSSSVLFYPMQGIQGFNVVMTSVLGGGGVASLRADKQGKAYAQMMLARSVQIPVDVLESVTDQSGAPVSKL